MFSLLCLVFRDSPVHEIKSKTWDLAHSPAHLVWRLHGCPASSRVTAMLQPHGVLLAPPSLLSSAPRSPAEPASRCTLP